MTWFIRAPRRFPGSDLREENALSLEGTRGARTAFSAAALLLKQVGDCEAPQLPWMGINREWLQQLCLHSNKGIKMQTG